MSRKKAARRPVVKCPRCGFDADPSAGTLNFCPGCGASLREGGGGSAGALRGRVVADRYRLHELIGEGGMGAVYKAEHIRMGKALALKILRGDFAREPGAVDRFLAEARIVSRLSHPHTIAVFDFGEVDEDGSGFYLAMEYVPGRDLAALLREVGRLPERRVADIGRQILGSLAEAHDAGIVHRDVKPGNVMLMQTRSDEDFVKVLDFGIAKLRHAGPDGGPVVTGSSPSTTSAGAIVGTPSYLAPEQARAGPIDARSDLYAVGCLLYELASGRPPFVAPSPMAVVAAHLHQEPPPLAQQAPQIGRAFAEIVHRALRKRPAERFASADEMREALHALAHPSSASSARRPARSTSRDRELRIASRDDFAHVERQVRTLRRGRVVAPLVGLAAVVGMAGAVAWLWADVYALAEARAPRIAQAIPASLRPIAARDGEREPNDAPADANALPLPPGADGGEAGGVAVVHGRLGARISGGGGDVDVFRVEVPAADGRKVLVAEWHGGAAGEGIPGLDAVLVLNRELPAGDPRAAAPLVASASRGGPGRPETLAAAVEPGTYYLSVRDEDGGATGPADRPAGAYVLEVRLVDPRPGEELEPDDGPDRAHGAPDRYPAWRRVAERNALEEGAPLRGETGPEDPDLYAVTARAGGGAPELVVAVPEPGLALAARLWVPDAEDDLPSAQQRVRLEEAGDAPAGRILALRLGAGAPEGAPVIVQVRAAAGEGSYRVAALGSGPASGAAVLSLARGLAAEGRSAAALELAAAYAGTFPDGASRDVLLLAGGVAAGAARDLPPGAIATFDRAGQLLGEAIFEEVGAKVVYRGAFEARAAAAGRRASAPRDLPSPEGASTAAR